MGNQRNHQANKRAIRAFLRHYTDERLAWLLAHARDGHLDAFSCCCLIGIATADHALRGFRRFVFGEPHYLEALELEGAKEAEAAYFALGKGRGADAERRRRLIPIVKAEMRQRARVPVHVVV